jgi:hypothetical protein
MDDGTIHEEYDEDVPFVEQRHDCPPPSFRVGRDVFVGYFLAVRPTDGDLCLFWVGRAVSNPNPDRGHLNQIQIQHWMPNTFEHVNVDMYSGWDLKEGNVWCEERGILPCWSYTNYVMTA